MPQTESRSFPLLDYLDQRVEKLRKLTPIALRGQDTNAIHDARVTTRRLKAAIDLLDPLLSERCRRPFARAGKDLRRRLGPLRDLDVMLEHLDQIRTPACAGSVAWLRKRIEDDREKALIEANAGASSARMLAKLGSWWGVRQNILDGRDDISPLLTQSVQLQLNALAEQADQLVQFIAAAPGAVAARNDPHQLRIAGKSLRYTLEMAIEHGVPLPATVMRQFNAMQDRLGLWHDYIVLTECVLRKTVDCDLALHDPGLQGQTLKLAQITLNKAQAELRKMAHLWSKKGNELARQIRVQFPLTKPPEPIVAEIAVKPATVAVAPPTLSGPSEPVASVA